MLLLPLLLCCAEPALARRQHVSDYTRSNGTHVSSYDREVPGPSGEELLVLFLIIAGVLVVALIYKGVQESNALPAPSRIVLPKKPPSFPRATEVYPAFPEEPSGPAIPIVSSASVGTIDTPCFCGRNLKTTEAMIGQYVQCRACGYTVKVYPPGPGDVRPAAKVQPAARKVSSSADPASDYVVPAFEQVSIQKVTGSHRCGAVKRDGSLCVRLVSGPGYCYQHR
jgi:hypothetical protein